MKDFDKERDEKLLKVDCRKMPVPFPCCIDSVILSFWIVLFDFCHPVFSVYVVKSHANRFSLVIIISLAISVL